MGVIHENGRPPRYKCPGGHRISMTADTVLESTHIASATFLLLIHCWVHTVRVVDVVRKDIDINKKTVGKWYHLFHIMAHSVFQGSIGGYGHVVEVDEALMRRRKYHRGRRKQQIWAFSGVERQGDTSDAPKMFFVICS